MENAITACFNNIVNSSGHPTGCGDADPHNLLTSESSASSGHFYFCLFFGGISDRSLSKLEVEYLNKKPHWKVKN